MPPASRERGSAALWAVAAVVVLIALARCNSADKAEPPRADAGARGACGLFIERVARNPSSLELIAQPSWTTLQNADGTWSVLAHYRAQNGFGGMNVERSTCVMRKDHAGDWTLITISRMQ